MNKVCIFFKSLFFSLYIIKGALHCKKAFLRELKLTKCYIMY